MGATNGAGAGSIERDARLENVLLGGGNSSQAKPHPPKNQFTTPRIADGAPRLAQPSWYHIAAVLAREPQDDTALSAAMRRALEREAAQ